MRKNRAIGVAAVLLLLILITVQGLLLFNRQEAASVNCFVEDFDTPRTIEENHPIEESGDPDWWLNSGAYFYIGDGVGRSIQGNLPSDDFWRLRYNETSPDNTRSGYRPQNILRLISRSVWQNTTQQAYFKINYYDLDNPHETREGSNAVLLFSRYVDGDNLYYAGIRVDGQVVIKKKVDGDYTTLGAAKVLPGIYDRDSNPNLLPLDEWIGVRLDVENLTPGTVALTLYTDVGWTGDWQLALAVTDTHCDDAGLALHNAAHVGIRTDYMDVVVEDYQVCEITPSHD